MAFSWPHLTMSSNDPPKSSDPTSSARPSDDSLLSQLASPRSRRQLGLFFGGAAFFAFSTLITRRSLARRYRTSIPAFYQPSNRPHGQANGAMEGFEALNIATINVTSFAMMATGGLLWAFDISSLADMRMKVRGAMGVPDRPDQDADEEMEEWLATVLARKDEKERRKRGTKDDDDQR